MCSRTLPKRRSQWVILRGGSAYRRLRVPDLTDRRQIRLLSTDKERHQYERVSSSMFTHLIPLIEQLTQDEIAAIETALHRVLAKEETAEDER